MKIFVINLSRSPERRASMEQQLSLLNLDYEIVEAVDGSQLSYTEIMKETMPLNYALSCGEVGCALSHINICKRIASEGIPMALILEDDALIDYRTVEVMSQIE
ncbi:glycosyltransferase family 25 protein (plasmid) [Pantoea alfalfae]|uniref:glycosyltransferase family 25 protein n=1 Tax=Pantoea alfalfae TaxID=3074822 RepID=UPI001CA42549|nr:glycosyltransferase family 25 protein [Pantoea alfalfae]QZX98138.1 glycosyltransferase family 25 protein [Pantoea alfalfae]